jgi:hypothetical protein
MSVQELPVDVPILPALRGRDDVVHLQQVPVTEEQSTPGAPPALQLQKD